MAKLVRNGSHMRPMLAVLERHNIGAVDSYGRGRWISESDLPAILEAIKSEPSAIRGGSAEDDYLCAGTNRHNYVSYRDDFKTLFD